MTLAWTAMSAQMIIAGRQLEYICHGPDPATAPTIILLHEGLGCIAMWRDFPAQLAATTGFGVFAYSRAGYGQSDPVTLPRPLDYMTREASDVLPAILDGIGFRRGILLGHSDGASIAAIYAGSHEDHRVRGLVLMAPHFFTEASGLAAIAEARSAYQSADLKARLSRYHRHPDNAFYGWNDAWLDPAFRQWNIADVIDYLRIPVLAIQGRDDQYGTYEQIREVESRSYAPVDVEILEACAHAPHIDQPARTLALISEFTRRLERIEAAEVITA